jgi:hypothetical protein
MTLVGKDALEFAERVARENAAKRVDAIARAKQAAVGKEPFDLATLETMCDTSSEGRTAPVAAREAKFEEMYDVDYPALMTLADFARKVNELTRW